jgi:glycosyltransferase involved in cell wall biosynthesis
LSVSCITYNHAPYLRDCLDGILKQRTSFPIEILIHDDASSDGTVEIIKEYHQKYPDLIFPFFQKENQYSKGVRAMMVRFNFPRARGKYLALCEGDDFWTDPDKLERQVKFLEDNPSFQLVFHNAVYLRNGMPSNDFKEKYIWLQSRNEFTVSDIIKYKWFIPTASMLFRNNMQYPSWLLKLNGGDLALQYLCSTYGKIKFLDFEGSVYRIHPNSVTSKKISKYQRFRKNAKEEWVYFKVIPLPHKLTALRWYLANRFRQILCLFDR